MSLIKGKSKEAFKKNVETEMSAGKPQKKSLAIAYAMKRKAPKKMADGGMAIKKENDSDSHIQDMTPKAPRSVYDNPDYAEAPVREAEQPKKPKKGMSIEGEPEMKAFGGIAGDSMTNHLRDDEEDEMDKDSPSNDGGDSPWYEESSQAQTSPSTPSNDKDVHWDLFESSGGHTAPGSASNDKDSKIDSIADRIIKKMAYGGIAGDSMTNHLRKDEEDEMGMDSPGSLSTSWYDEVLRKDSTPGAASNDHDATDTIADRIMRKKMAYGGSVDENDQEDGQTPYDIMNAHAYDKKVYDVSQLSAQPTDSNEHGDIIEGDEDDHSIVSAIMRRMKAKKKGE